VAGQLALELTHSYSVHLGNADPKAVLIVSSIPDILCSIIGVAGTRTPQSPVFGSMEKASWLSGFLQLDSADEFFVVVAEDPAEI
jgi:hypothetical protein